MNRKHIILFSVLLSLALGAILFFWLRGHGRGFNTSETSGDSLAIAQDTTAIDTAADMRIIREYYVKGNNGSVSSEDGWEQLNATHLTETAIDNILMTDGDYDATIRAQEVPRNFQKTLRVVPLKGGWYMVCFKTGGESGWERIPVRMVTDKDGRRKIGYITPIDLGQTASDTIFYHHVIHIPKQHKYAVTFIEDFYRSYLSTKLTIDLDAPAYQRYLIRHFVDKKYWAEVGRHLYLNNNLIDDLVFNATPKNGWKPQYEVYVTRKSGWYGIHSQTSGVDGDHYVKVEKRGNGFIIAKFSSAPPTKGADGDESYDRWTDQQPQFAGGEATLSEYLTEQVHYPKAELEMGISAKIDVVFMVEKDGSISNIEVAADATEGFEAEAFRLLGDMPEWTPAMWNDRLVRSFVYGTLFFKVYRNGSAEVEFIRRAVNIDDND